MVPNKMDRITTRIANRFLQASINYIIHKSEEDDVLYYYFMAEDGGSFATMYLYKDDPDSMFLAALSVSEQHRKQGRGSELLDQMESFGRDLGCLYSYLWAKKDSWMLDWYQRRGYKIYSEKDSEYIWLRKVIITH